MFFKAASLTTVPLGISSVHLTDGRNESEQTRSCQHITSTGDYKEQSTIFF